MPRRLAIGFALAIGLIGVAGFVPAQAQETFTARLSWVPISGAERGDVAGQGSATATLTRSQLAITGSFEGLPAAATRASLHQGVAVGARGPAIAELRVTNARDGEISSDVELNRDQLAALMAGQLYVQVHAERGVAPDNAVLWGWLLGSVETSSSRRRTP